MVKNTSVEVTEGMKKDLDEVKKFLVKEYNINASYKDVIAHLYRLWKQDMGNRSRPAQARKSENGE